MKRIAPDPIRGVAAGLAAGIIASFAMDRFQSLWSRAIPMPASGDPATVKVAQKASRAAAGKPLPSGRKRQGGTIVHYLFGAGLGAAYGLIAEYRPGVTRSLGSGLALSSATLFDEIAVPAAGLGNPPAKAPAITHVYAYASHLLFGGVTEMIRRQLRAR